MLHLLGLDLHEGGLSGAKLYFLHPAITPAELARQIGHVPVVDQLARSGLVNLLRIHRVTEAGDLPRASEVDFLLAENDLVPEELWATASLAPLDEPSSPLL